MKCPECQAENRNGVTFCEDCGAKMELECPNCEAKIPLGKKFCGKCGHNLLQPEEALPSDLSFEEKLAKIQKYLPSGLTEKVLSQRNKIEGERRQVTIMFVDMKGFTPLTEKLGPEETFSLMDQVFEILIHKVHEYEGTVNELRGDGILAFFGAPVALEDAPQRAIRSALSIHREMTKFNDKIKGDGRIPPVQLRIGINTGPVVIGTVGNDLRVQFTAIGDTINMAARMEQMAEPGTTYVTEDTFKLTEGFFRFEALGEKAVKGKDKPLNVYRVIAPSTRKTRFDVSAERGLTRFVGRERELEIMLDAFERAKAGRGQAVSIVGEAGVGKSRLLYEFRKAVANEDVTFLEGKCLSYSRGLAYHPIIDVLKSNFGIEDEETESNTRAKVKSRLALLGAEEATTLPYLLELLSVRDSGIEDMPMSPEAKKVRIVRALQRIFLKGSEIRPLIFATEDLHWMDQSSEEAAKYLLDSVPASRVLMIFTYRPEFVHTWGAKSYHSQVTLNRLSNRESLAMVAHLLDAEEIATDLGDLIIEKTEGVPFFIEELVRSLRDSGTLQRTNGKYHLVEDISQLALPSTIHDVIMARVDLLPEESKQVLQAGAAIEREFSYKLIQAVANLAEPTLMSHLSNLKDSELLYERGIYPQHSYMFKHALTRDVVYDSIIAPKRKQLHERIGNAIEVLHAEGPSQNYSALAEHYLIAENYSKAAEYSRLAGKQATKIGSLNDALSHAQNRISCLEMLEQTRDVMREIVEARTSLGLYFVQMDYISDAEATIRPIAKLPDAEGHESCLPRLQIIQGIYKGWIGEEFPESIRLLENAVEDSKQLQDIVALVHARFWSGVMSSFVCAFGKAAEHMKHALNINIRAHNEWGIAVGKSVIGTFVHYFQGTLDEGHKTSLEAIRSAESSGDAFSKCRAYISHGVCCFGKGDMQGAKADLSLGGDFSEKIAASVWNALAQFFMGEISYEQKRYEDAKYNFLMAIRLLELTKGLPTWVNLITVATGAARIGSKEQNIRLERLRDRVAEPRIKLFQGLMYKYLGEIFLNIDDQHFSEAQHWIEEAIEADERNGMRFHLGRDYAVYAEFFKRKGDGVKAKEQLGKAIEIYKECGADGWVTKAEGELEKLS